MLQPLHGGKAAVRERAVSNCQSSGSCREDSTMWSVWCSIKCSKAAHSMNRPGLHLCAGRKVRTGAHRHSMRPVGSTNSCTTAVMKTHGGATHVSLHAQHHNHLPPECRRICSDSCRLQATAHGVRPAPSTAIHIPALQPGAVRRLEHQHKCGWLALEMCIVSPCPQSTAIESPPLHGLSGTATRATRE